MTWYKVISTDFSFIFITLFSLLMISRDKKRNRQLHALFYALINLSIALVILNHISNALADIPGTYRWCSLITHVKYVIKPTLLYLVLLISERDRPRRVKVLLGVPLLIETVTLMVCYPFDLAVYYTEAENFFHVGPLFAVTWVILPIYLVLIAVSAVVTHRWQREFFYILLSTSFIVFNMICELLLKSIPGMEMCVIALSILVYYLYFVSHTYGSLLRKREQELALARIQAMTSQIKPHFIYNTLACIAEICHDGSPEGEEAILTFSAYLRRCFESLDRDGLIPFSDELMTIDRYIELEQLQTPDRISVVYDIREKDFLIPLLSVETLVENAVKHGIRKKRGGGTVTLSSARDERGIVITVKDDGVGFDPASLVSDGKHLGLTNARMRLSEQCGATLSVDSAPGQGTQIVIVIPEEKRK